MRKPLTGSVGAGVPMLSITGARKTSRIGSLVPPTSVASSVSVATAPAYQQQEQQPGAHRSLRRSNTSGMHPRELRVRVEGWSPRFGPRWRSRSHYPNYEKLRQLFPRLRQP
jgi:hypothetical protein